MFFLQARDYKYSNGPGENRTPAYRMQTGRCTTELRAPLEIYSISK